MVNNRIDFNNFDLLKNSITLEDLFKQIFDIVKQQLDTIMKEEGNEDKFFIQRKEINESYCSPDYLDKNIRIRPMTGHGEGDGVGGLQKTFLHPKDEDDDTEKKDEEEWKLLIEEQWEACKKRVEEYHWKKRVEEEKKRRRNY